MPSITSSNIPVRELITQRNRKRMDTVQNSNSGSGGANHSTSTPHSMFLSQSPLSFGQIAAKGGLFRAAAAAAGEPALPPMQLHLHHHHDDNPQPQPYRQSLSHKRPPSPMESLKGFERPPPLKRERLDEDRTGGLRAESHGEKKIQRNSPG